MAKKPTPTAPPAVPSPRDDAEQQLRQAIRATRKGRAALRAAYQSQRAGEFDREAFNQAVLQRRRQQQADAGPSAAGAARDAPAPGLQAQKGALWMPMGPTVVLGGQADGAPNVSGRVRDVWVSPDGLRVYAGTANGGVWFSGDGGDTWKPLGGWTVTGAPPTLNQPAGVLACGCLWVRFGANQSADEVLVGTGEPRVLGLQGTPGAPNAGVGVLRSVGPADAADTGTPWNLEATNLANKRIYRIAADPDAATPTSFVAATTEGLWFRTAGPQANWTQVAVAPFGGNVSRLNVTDAVWVRGAGAIASRLWVAVRDNAAAPGTYGRSGVYVSSGDPTLPATTYSPVSLGVFGGATSLIQGSRISLAAAPSDASVVYALADGPLVWRIDNVTATPVVQIPPDLFTAQADYDQTIAVHPTRPQRIALGGCFTKVPAGVGGRYNAAIFVANVTRPNPAGNYLFGFVPATAGDSSSAVAYVGVGVHADVHMLRFVTVGAGVQLWTGCDGGVFRSMRGDDDNRLMRGSFVSRNSGMCTLECGYVATHPNADGHLIAGTQDNGTLTRVGVTLWQSLFLGDGGAVAYHPITPERIAAQYVQAGYHRFTGAPNFGAPVLRANAPYGLGAADLIVARRVENSVSSFYCGMSAVADGTGGARVAVGTYRPWFSINWGAAWVTLPLFADPYASPSAVVQGNQDACVLQADGVTADMARGQVLACRWANANRLYLLCQRAVICYDLVADATAVNGFGLRCNVRELALSRPHKSEDPQTAAAIVSPGQRLPEVGAWSDLAVHDPAAGTHGSFYVATTGLPASPTMDTLWWFDGTDRWHATGLRTKPEGVAAPAYAVVVDPAQPADVYVGTAVGVWRGRKRAGASVGWDWQVLSNGLPEAAVHDLTIHVDAANNLRLLRAAIQARGVWEYDLTAPLAPVRTFVRVHAWDTRRIAPTVLLNPTKNAAAADAPLSFAASPDIRIHPRRGSAPPPFQRISVPNPTLIANTYLHWVFQTALHAVDPLVRPTGVRTPQFEARLRAANAHANPSRITRTVWNAIVGTAALSPNAFAPPWNAASPSEADLFELIVDRPVPAANPCAQLMAAKRCQVHVQVHHRHTTPVLAGDVRVTLLRRAVTGVANIGAALPVAWTVAVQAAVRAAATPSPLPVLADGWTFADEAPAQAVRSPTAALDVRQSRTVTFDVDLRGLAAADRVMLVAVVHTTADAATLPAAANLQALVLGCRFVAARCIEIG
jgi:hypothetical protein